MERSEASARGICPTAYPDNRLRESETGARTPTPLATSWLTSSDETLTADLNSSAATATRPGPAPTRGSTVLPGLLPRSVIETRSRPAPNRPRPP